MQKSILQLHEGSSVQKKKHLKNTKYSTKKGILKIDHLAKADLCKMVGLGQKFKCQKTCRNRFYNYMKVVLWKRSASKEVQRTKH